METLLSGWVGSARDPLKLSPQWRSVFPVPPYERQLERRRERKEQWRGVIPFAVFIPWPFTSARCISKNAPPRSDVPRGPPLPPPPLFFYLLRSSDLSRDCLGSRLRPVAVAFAMSSRLPDYASEWLTKEGTEKLCVRSSEGVQDPRLREGVLPLLKKKKRE